MLPAGLVGLVAPVVAYRHYVSRRTRAAELPARRRAVSPGLHELCQHHRHQRDMGNGAGPQVPSEGKGIERLMDQHRGCGLDAAQRNRRTGDMKERQTT